MASYHIFSLMNIAGINSQIIYKANTDTTISRRQFLKSLGQDLCKPFMVQQLNCKNLSFDLRKQINRFTGQISTPSQEGPRPTERVKCAYCPARKNRYTVVSRYTTKLKYIYNSLFYILYLGKMCKVLCAIM
jgi:hypothetical protein